MPSTSYNVITHGNVVNTNGVLSNFSVGNYATLPQIYTFGSYSWEFNIKFTTGEDVSTNQGVLTPVAPNSSDQRDAINIWVTGGYIAVGLADTISTKIYDNAPTTASPNTTYFLKIKYQDGTYYLKYSTDGITYIDGTGSPVTSTKKLWDCGQVWGFGTARNVDRPFNGTIDLSGCSLIINNQLVWRGTTTTGTRIVNRHDTAANWTSINPVLAAGEMGVETDTSRFKFGNGSSAWSELPYATSGPGGSVDAYTKAETDELLTGKQDKLTAISPIEINTQTVGTLNNLTKFGDGNISDDMIFNLTQNSYLVSDKVFPINTANSWYYQFKIKITYPVNTDRILIAGNTTTPGKEYNHFMLHFTSINNLYSPRVQLSTNGTQWTNYLENTNITLSDNTIYYLRVGWNNNQYYMKYSLTGDDSSFISVATSNSSSKITNRLPLRINMTMYNTSVYLDEYKLYINDSLYWKAADVTYGGKAILANPATTTSLGVVKPDGTSITVSETGIISGQDVKTFTGYSSTGTLVLKSIDGVLQWVAES